MEITLTQKGLDLFKKMKKLSGGVTSHDFVFIYNDCNCPSHEQAKINKKYPDTFKCGVDGCFTPYHHHYNCNFGEEMEINEDHYANSKDLQEFVNQRYFEIVSI